MGNMRIVKLSEETCRALEQMGVLFEEIGVATPRLSKGGRSQPCDHLSDPENQRRSGERSTITTRPNPKAVGRENRREYLEQLHQHGVALKHERRTAYVTPRGNRVVLPLANRPWSPGKWFLGAPKNFFSKSGTALVLICKENTVFQDFILPPEDIQKLVPMLTEVRGELRFNVRRDDGKYYLYRPGVDK